MVFELVQVKASEATFNEEVQGCPPVFSRPSVATEMDFLPANVYPTPQGTLIMVLHDVSNNIGHSAANFEVWAITSD
ncbi:hypothetical protein DSO57_1004927 [Entomophthora muscae]|uniref:Uncharacterized protein n=1 Tax=Entomophthora muscae TaxID=34485 RepID=A0ACC2T7Y8_9FUNG|nr:hypothetical protein DSO57_1004927 [Entomophthora muscae]